MSNPTKVILCLVGAAALGAAVGLLLAPDSGSETRQKISEKANDFASSLGDYIKDAKDKIVSKAKAVPSEMN